MNFIDRVDPELRGALDLFPPDLLDLNRCSRHPGASSPISLERSPRL